MRIWIVEPADPYVTPLRISDTPDAMLTGIGGNREGFEVDDATARRWLEIQQASDDLQDVLTRIVYTDSGDIADASDAAEAIARAWTAGG